MGSWDSFLYAVEAASGKERWRFKSGEDPYIHNQARVTAVRGRTAVLYDLPARP